jgi:hypothetical protein
MIDVKQAVKIATDFVNDVLSSEKIDRITFEEVELDEGQSCWYITLGLGTIVKVDPFAVLSGKPSQLHVRYKVFKIDRGSGEVISMKIRKEDE